MIYTVYYLSLFQTRLSYTALADQRFTDGLSRGNCQSLRGSQIES